MKAVVINADPRRKAFNAQLMKSAAKGAESAGAEVEYVDLYKLDLSGCRICLICKKEGRGCKCYWRDELSPLIERILDADVLLIGAGIFFSEPTSHYRALIERLIFCIVSFEVGNLFKGKINVGLFYTIEYSKDYFNESIRPHLKQSEDLFGMLNGEVVIDSFSYTPKNVRLGLSQSEIDSLNEEQDENFEKAFEIAAGLCK
ncbi:flavodoxin family protein [Methanobrevibacter sp.]|uniref:flavodoxin family protein n=1 Tax=Methanobrevibacter sp. TaxID=66852 RepID=UPI00388E2695